MHWRSIVYRRSQETLAEVPSLKQLGYYNTAVNRLYYACYYAAVALLIRHGINPGTHAGVKQMMATSIFSISLKRSMRNFLSKR